MGRDTFVLGLSALCSVSIMAWIIWSKRPGAALSAPEPAPTTEAAASPPPVDQARVSELEAAASEDPGDVASRVELGNLYFGAHVFEAAVPWYEQALALEPDDLQSSTNLGVSYFYAGQAERAVAQFQHSLEMEPDHPQTLLNLGIVLAFGMDDLEGATTAWQRVLEVAPDGREARAAREALNRVTAELGAPGTGEPQLDAP